MLLKTKGIVLRKMNYKESSIIVDVFTIEVGLRSLIISGVRKSKATHHANLFQIMSQLDLVMYDKDPTGLNRIKEVKAFKLYESIPFDIKKSLVGQFMVEVLRKTINHDEANESMFFFIIEWFNFLDATNENTNNLLLIFLVQLAEQVGYGFQLDDRLDTVFDLKAGVFTPTIPDHGHYMSADQAFLFKKIIDTTMEESHLIRIDAKSRSQMIDQLLKYFQYHIESFQELTSLEILRSVLR